jgi:hypothetical protein
MLTFLIGCGVTAVSITIGFFILKLAHAKGLTPRLEGAVKGAQQALGVWVPVGGVATIFFDLGWPCFCQILLLAAVLGAVYGFLVPEPIGDIFAQIVEGQKLPEPERINNVRLSRFPEQINVTSPDVEQRIKLLRLLIGERRFETPLHRDMLLPVLAKECDSMSGQDLRTLVERAILYAIERATQIGRPLEFVLCAHDFRIALDEARSRKSA